jgi:pimeloyl-ACP methyl ester carboxylesterase
MSGTPRRARQPADRWFFCTAGRTTFHSFIDVVPLLASAGYRVIVPYVRGYGTTSFLSGEAFRNGQQTALAADVIALMDALKINKAVIAGFDWGARTANIMAVLWPERCKGIVAVSGYLIANRDANRQPLPPHAEYAWWYQYYFATERGERGYSEYRRDFSKLIWKLASPKWQFDDTTFDRAAQSLDNPDHVSIVIHNYRWRLGLAAGEPQYDAFEAALAHAPPISVPAITLQGDADGEACRAASEGTPFMFEPLGIMASLGHTRAVARAFGVRRTYYLFQMPRWDRRLRIVLDWTVALFFRPAAP